MSYLPNEENTFINIKLTDDGRRLMSLGKLTFDKGVMSDREINYGIVDDAQDYDIACRNRIISPKDSSPTFSSPNSFDGSAAFPIMLGSAKQVIRKETESIGFFSGLTGSSASWEIDVDKCLGVGEIDYNENFLTGDTDTVKLTPAITAQTNGSLVYIPWETPSGTGATGNELLSGNPINSLWYRVLSADTGSTGSTTVRLDRPIPNFGTGAANKIKAYFYPFNGIEDYYSKAGDANKPVEVWNMNIIRTSSVEGTNSSMSGYTTYGSIQYNGTKHYLGFRDETRQVGVIHFTNEFTGNTYAEQLEEKTVEIEIPNVMWHNNYAPAGNRVTYGISLRDIEGSTYFDSVSQTSFRELRDGAGTKSAVVGRVYHKLKMVVITDPELLAALTYKSNRLYTLPPFELGAVTNPVSSCGSNPIDYSNTTGLLEEGYAYFATYLTESDSDYLLGASYGYPKTIPCQYIQRIDGELSELGEPKYLKASFDGTSFPYLRNSSSMTGGTGWNANKVQLLINRVDLSDKPGVDLDTIPSDGWKLIPNSGVYTGSTSQATIDSLDLLSHQFNVSKEDYNSGTKYVLDEVFRNENSTSGLTFGDESFLFGNLKCTRLSTVYKTIITVLAPTYEFNDSNNESFDGGDTYITEIGVLNNDNVLVAVGKPTYPIKKNSSRYLSFQLEIDF